MTPCKSCKTKAKCKKAGKCLKKPAKKSVKKGY